ncbi:MAG: hypothetical protein WC492_03960 [Candidatus Micrarchaeia archaeon]
MQPLEENKKLLPPYEMIGTIAMLDLPRGFKGEKKAAAQILKEHSNIKTVSKKASATGGKYRIRKIKFIAGEKTSKTICKECGCSFAIDLNKAYYTPRFSHERLRICEQVKEGEKILIPFAGIGPYPIVIEKNAKQKPKQIISIELNPSAFKLMEENISANKCKKIIAIKADAAKILNSKKYKNWANRIIMPHPSASLEFFPSALKAAKRGATIHLYAFDEVGKEGETIFSKAKQIAKKQKISLKKIGWRVARPFSAKTEQVVLDLKVGSCAKTAKRK